MPQTVYDAWSHYRGVALPFARYRLVIVVRLLIVVQGSRVQDTDRYFVAREFLEASQDTNAWTRLARPLLWRGGNPEQKGCVHSDVQDERCAHFLEPKCSFPREKRARGIAKQQFRDRVRESNMPSVRQANSSGKLRVSISRASLRT